MLEEKLAALNVESRGELAASKSNASTDNSSNKIPSFEDLLKSEVTDLETGDSYNNLKLRSDFKKKYGTRRDYNEKNGLTD